MDHAEIAKRLAAAVGARLDAPSRDWLRAASRKPAEPLTLLLAQAGKRARRVPVTLSKQEADSLRDAGLDGGLIGWRLDEAARAALICAAAARFDGPRLQAEVAQAYRFADAGEREALLRVQPLLRPAAAFAFIEEGGFYKEEPARRSPNPTDLRSVEPLGYMSRRSPEDYETMARAGLAAVVEPCRRCAPYGGVGALEDELGALLREEPRRARAAGLAHFAVLGLGPREARDAGVVEGGLWLLERLLAKEFVVAVGELGLERGTREEESLFREQLALARRRGLPALARAGWGGPERAVALARDCGFPEERLLVTGLSENGLGAALDAGCWAALTVGGSEDAGLLRRWGARRLMITGEPSWNGGKVCAAPSAAKRMLETGAPLAEVRRLVFGNPAEFYGLGRVLEAA